MGVSLDFTPDSNDTNNVIGSNDGTGNYGLQGPGTREWAAITGFMVGGAPGAIAGYHYGDKIGRWSENTWNSITGKNARIAAEKAGKAAEKERRESIMKQMGAQEQADTIAYGAAMRGGGNNDSPGVVGLGGEGTIGANIGSSGTF